ncbi:DM13 domain-containing protein [uncultured Psychrosphaera sp.]|uniref:DM13 domain-containing protein n=1 Tax=uncultured Psychrosphaera sp. TaxID=1403522 RepID=UPI0026183803|nr:DM13 domain-containing protein [uncultured Psychrosphaera sp.]
MNLKSSYLFMLISLISACSDGMSDSEDKVSEVPEDITNVEVQLRECASNHVMVGQTGELSTLAHSVSGTATIVDDCTIEITNFNYDGGGIIVEVYAGIDEDYQPPVGFAISENIFGTRFENQTFTVQLPTNKTLDDLNGISIWCSDVGVSFGDSLFN